MAQPKVAPTRSWRYRTNCTDSTSFAIVAMQDAAREVTRQTFLKYVDLDSLHAVEDILGYERNARHGLTMAQDGYVTYHLSEYRGRSCAYFRHSAIEFIFY